MLSELGRLTAQMRAASGARAERQPADGRALEAHQRHVKEEKVMSQTGDFHWLINNLLWQLIYRASGFGFLPKQLFTAAFIKTPFSLSPCYASCYLGVPPGTGFPGDWGAVLGLLPLAFPLVGGSGQSTEVGYCHSRVRVYCPAQLGAWVLDLLYVYSAAHGYPRTNGRGQVSPVPVPTCTCTPC